MRRVRLLCTCRTLRLRPDVLASRALWGSVQVGAPAGHHDALAAWLGQRAGGLRRLRLGLEHQAALARLGSAATGAWALSLPQRGTHCPAMLPGRLGR